MLIINNIATFLMRSTLFVSNIQHQKKFKEMRNCTSECGREGMSIKCALECETTHSYPSFHTLVTPCQHQVIQHHANSPS